MTNSLGEFTDEEYREAFLFVIKDNPHKKWNEEELYDAVYNHLIENTVISNLEELIKEGYVKEISPDQFVPTEKGLKYLKKENLI